MTNKKTMKEFYGEIIEIVANAGRQDLVEFCNNRIELINKKADTKTKAEKEENIKLMEDILSALTSANKEMTISDLQKFDGNLLDFSTSKITAYMKKLIEQGKVKREEVKGKAYFSIM